MDGFVIEVDDPRREDVRALLEQHLRFAKSVTRPEDVYALELDGLLDPAIAFYSLRFEGEVAWRPGWGRRSRPRAPCTPLPASCRAGRLATTK